MMENLEDITPSIFDEYFEDEENKLCVDCGDLNPVWCSMSFGVLICLKCSGFHRALGVHVTQVRSINLDDWNENQLQYLKCGGNRKFKVYLNENVKNIKQFDSILTKYKDREVLYYREILISLIEHREPRKKEDNFFYETFNKINSPTSSKSSPKDSPKWIPDEESTVCLICENSFTLFNRRHHCRRCGKVVCKTCAPATNTRPIIEWGMKNAVRHCKLCYKSPNITWN